MRDSLLDEVGVARGKNYARRLGNSPSVIMGVLSSISEDRKFGEVFIYDSELVRAPLTPGNYRVGDIVAVSITADGRVDVILYSTGQQYLNEDGLPIGTPTEDYAPYHPGTELWIDPTDDGLPPPTPGAPDLSTELGVVTVILSGYEPPRDFDRFEIAAEQPPEGEVAQLETVINELRAPQGTVTLPDFTYDREVFVRVRVVDRFGEISEWSPIVSIMPKPLVDEDYILSRIDATEVLIENAGKIVFEDGKLLDQKLAEMGDVDLDELYGRLDELEDVTLPGLNDRLLSAEQILGPLPGSISALEGQVGTLQIDLQNSTNTINQLKNTTIPALAADLDAAETAISVTLPGAISDAKAAGELAQKISHVSTSLPTEADGVGRPVNALWTQIDASGNEIAYRRWNGSSWVTQAMSATVIPNLAASKITSGTINTARLNTTEIAAAVATVIQLNADRITSGTINTARLNATEIAAAVGSFVKIDASQITSGLIQAARINTTEVAASIATIIQLDAARITSGTISTARLNASEIGAAVGQFVKISADQINAVGAGFTTAVAENLWAVKISAKKILANEVIIGGPGNLLPENTFEPTLWSGVFSQEDGSGYSGSWSMLAPASTSQSGSYLGTNPAAYSYRTPVEPGRTYKVSVWVRSAATATAGNLRIYGRFFDNRDSATPARTAMLGSNTSDILLNTWGQITAEFTPNEGENWLAPGLFTQPDHQAATRWSDLEIVPMVDASLVVAGTIGAREISASEAVWTKVLGAHKITSVELDVNELRASQAFIGALRTGMITIGGVWGASEIGGLPASQITSGTLTDARIPSLSASKITSGAFAEARIPTLSTSKVSGLPAKITAYDVIEGRVQGWTTPGQTTINGGQITANSIKADRLDVLDVRASLITSDMFVGKTFIGGTFEGTKIIRGTMTFGDYRSFSGPGGSFITADRITTDFGTLGGQGWLSFENRAYQEQARDFVTVLTSPAANESLRTSLELSSGGSGFTPRITFKGASATFDNIVYATKFISNDSHGIGHLRHGSPVLGSVSGDRPLKVAFGTSVAAGGKRTIAHNAGFSAVFHISLTLRDQNVNAREVILGNWWNENGFDCYVYQSSGSNAGTSRVDYLIIGI